MAAGGRLDTGYKVTGLGMAIPAVIAAPNDTRSSDAEVTEVQVVELVGNSSFGGGLTLKFNDATSRLLPIADLLEGALPETTAAAMVLSALEELPTISRVGVNVSASNDTILPTTGEVGSSILISVSFHFGSTVASPLNLGPLPLIEAGVDAVKGLVAQNVSSSVRGASPVNFSFSEQTISLELTPAQLEALGGGFILNFSSAVTGMLFPNSSSATMRVALMELATVGELEVFRSDTPAGRSWLVRFYSEAPRP